MACTALMDQPVQPMYFPLLDDPFSPGVRNLQRTIEAAWKDGTSYCMSSSRLLPFVFVQDTTKRVRGIWEANLLEPRNVLVLQV